MGTITEKQPLSQLCSAPTATYRPRGHFHLMSDPESGETNHQPWLEPRLRRAHEAVLEEPLPADMVDLVRRFAAKTEPEREG
jgi:hypothetical protein